jgi:hypothetical protein
MTKLFAIMKNQDKLEILGGEMQKILSGLEETSPKMSFKCNACEDAEFLSRDGNVFPCKCLMERKVREYALRIIPSRYVDARVSTLVPCDKIVKAISIERQQRVIDTIKFNPLAGYLFFGPTGVGKTHLLYSLANEAVYARRHVIAASASTIIKSAREAEFNKSFAPIIDFDLIGEYTGRDVANSGILHIFIDELDKIKLSEWSQLLMFDLINMAYDNPDTIKISITSNLSPKSFEENYGAAFYRKLKDISKSIVYGG